MLDEAEDTIKALISEIPEARTIAARRILAKDLLDHFTFFIGEVHHAIDEAAADEFE